jgi:hypothetical protein
MAENKTRPTRVSVAGFLKKAAVGQQLKDSQELVKLFRELTGKPALVLYLAPYPDDKPLKAKLGKHKAGAGCLYIKSLDDIDREVLRKLAKASIAELRRRYPG